MNSKPPNSSSGGTLENLTSSFNFFYKYVFPTLWLGGFGTGTLLLLIQGKPEAGEFVAAFFAGLALMWNLFSLKRVRLAGTSLLVSNYIREIKIPGHMIDGISETLWMSPGTITIHLRQNTEFGQSVRFIPQKLFREFFSATSVKNKLREVAGGNFAAN